MSLRARHRAGLRGLAVAAVLSTVFSLWPGLDLAISAACRDAAGRFIGNDMPWAALLYRAVPAWGWALAGGGAMTGLACRLGWQPLGPRWTRRLIALGLVSALASGLMINAGLKAHWGRARPVQVQAFGGTQQFTSALQPTDQCARNCSFSSGHAASGFVIMAAGLLGSAATRRRWLGIGLAGGALAGSARVLQGAHFLSDVLFSGLFVWAAGWVIREAWLRLRARRRRRHRRRHAPPM